MSNTNTHIFTSVDKPAFLTQNKIIDFLYEHLENFGDPKEYIKKAIDYAMSPYPSQGGYILAEYDGDEIVGAVVINNTGMSGYIPENILVYIATHKDYRGSGLGKKLMHKSQEIAKGDIALHVEHDNPALKLYEKVGFTNKYLEMRWENENK
ncbi:MAG: GNAT family N-acetyltransferase [Flavobacteriales bacterium]